MFHALLADRSPYRKLLVLIGFALFFVVIFTLLASLGCVLFYGINPFTDPGIMNDTNNPQVVSALKLMQAFSAIGLFIVPVLAAAFLFDTNLFAWLKLNVSPKAIQILLVLLTILISGPVINYMMELNKHLSLPEILKSLEEWMRDSEDRADEITKVFLEVSGLGGLLVNLFVIALLPAIGEELLFRGGVQKLLIEMTKNKHAGIILSAIAFSALHLQFYGFLPRMMLGIYLGYLVLWSGSLWLSIFAHFINNAGAVILFFLQKRNQLSFDPDTIGTQTGDNMFLLTSMLLTTGFIWMTYKSGKNRSNVLQNSDGVL